MARDTDPKRCVESKALMNALNALWQKKAPDVSDTLKPQVVAWLKSAATTNCYWLEHRIAKFLLAEFENVDWIPRAGEGKDDE